MAALNFPSSPANGDYHRENGATFRYNSTTTAWETMLTAAASGSGSGGPATYLDQNLGFTEGIRRIFIQLPAGADTNMMSIGAQIGGGGLTLFGYGHVSYPGRFELAAWSVAGQAFLIGTPLGELSWGGNFTASRLISNVADGTAPLTVTSTTLVTNLNADRLDGYHASAFMLAGSGGTGDVVGPGSAVSNNIVTFDGTTGKLIKDSGVTLEIVSSNPRLSFDTNDYIEYNRALNRFDFKIGSATVLQQSATEFYSAPTTNFSVEVGTRALYINATTGFQILSPLEVSSSADEFVATISGGHTTGAGLKFTKTDGVDRSWIMLATGSTAGVGDSKFGLYDLTAGAYRWTVDSAGNIGVGVGTGAGEITAYLYGTFGQVIRGSIPALAFIGTEVNAKNWLLYENAGVMRFYESVTSADHVYINTTGLGLGIIPTSRLHAVFGNSNTVSFYTGNSGIFVGNAEQNGVVLRIGAAWGYPGIYTGGSCYTMGEVNAGFVVANVVRAHAHSGGFVVNGQLLVDYNSGNGISGPTSGTWAGKIIQHVDATAYNGLSVQTRWGGSEAIVLEAAVGWNGAAAGYYPMFSVYGNASASFKSASGTVLFGIASNGALTVASATLVTNLNADYLDGQHGAYYMAAPGTYPNADYNTSLTGFWHAADTAANRPVNYYAHRWDWVHGDGSGNWVAQFAAPTSGNAELYYRQKRNGSWGAWAKFLTNTYSTDMVSGVGIRFGHANQTDANDGYIGAALFASGLNIVGTQTVLAQGRVVRMWGTLLNNATGNYLYSGSGTTAFYTDSDATYDYIYFDANDYIRYSRTGNEFGIYIGGVRQFYLIDTEAGFASGIDVSMKRLWVSVATGTSPFVITSTTLVSNLHAHYARQMTAFPFTTDWATTFAQVPAHQRTWAETSSGGPAGTWWFIENMRHSNGTSTWGTQLAWGWEDNRNQLWQRNVQGGSWDSWVRYFNSGTGSTAFYTASDGTYDYINFDANDSYRYNRTLNHHELYVNNVRVFYQSATEFYSVPSTNFSVEVGTRAFYINATTGTSVIGPFAITGAMSISVTTLVTNLNADYVDGYHASEAATGSTVVARTSGGYVYAAIFNMNWAAETSAASHYLYQYNSDGFIRRKTLANVKDELFSAVTNGYSGGPASKSFTVADSSGTHTFSSVWQGLVYVREYTYGNHCLLIFDSSNGVTIVSQNSAGLFVASSTPAAGHIGVYVSGGFLVFKNNTGWGTITLRVACLSADTLPN